MKTNNQYVPRITFIDNLNAESIAMTGRGVYVYLNPMEIEQLYGRYQNISSSVKEFARQCVRAALGQG